MQESARAAPSLSSSASPKRGAARATLTSETPDKEPRMRHDDGGRVHPFSRRPREAAPGPEKHPGGRLGVAAVMAAALAVLAGCASFPSVEGDPIPDMSAIAGK